MKILCQNFKSKNVKIINVWESKIRCSFICTFGRQWILTNCNKIMYNTVYAILLNQSKSNIGLRHFPLRMSKSSFKFWTAYMKFYEGHYINCKKHLYLMRRLLATTRHTRVTFLRRQQIDFASKSNVIDFQYIFESRNSLLFNKSILNILQIQTNWRQIIHINFCILIKQV